LVADIGDSFEILQPNGCTVRSWSFLTSL